MVEYNAMVNDLRWHKVSEAVRAERGKCRLCGCSEYGLQVHHIRYGETVADFLNKDNLAVLCPECHKHIHDAIYRIKNIVSNKHKYCEVDKDFNVVFKDYRYEKDIHLAIGDVMVEMYVDCFCRPSCAYNLFDRENYGEVQAFIQTSADGYIFNSTREHPFDTYGIQQFILKAKERRDQIVKRYLEEGRKPWQIKQWLKLSDQAYSKIVNRIRNEEVKSEWQTNGCSAKKLYAQIGFGE